MEAARLLLLEWGIPPIGTLARRSGLLLLALLLVVEEDAMVRDGRLCYVLVTSRSILVSLPVQYENEDLFQSTWGLTIMLSSNYHMRLMVY